jgi:hypothetical protein
MHSHRQLAVSSVLARHALQTLRLYLQSTLFNTCSVGKLALCWLQAALVKERVLQLYGASCRRRKGVLRLNVAFKKQRNGRASEHVHERSHVLKLWGGGSLLCRHCAPCYGFH